VHTRVRVDPTHDARYRAAYTTRACSRQHAGMRRQPRRGK
jgi:hypothetical protein